MSAPTLTEFSRLLLALYRNAQELPVHEFQDAVLTALKSSLPFDRSVWGTATMTPTGIDVHSLHQHNFPDEMMAAFLGVRHQDSAAVRVTQQPRMTIGFSAEEEFWRPEQAEIRQFARDYSQPHCLVTSDINPLTRFVQWVSLFRSDPRQRCTEQEVEFLDALGPHLMQALAINRLVHLERLLGDTARESWSVAIADPRGVLYHADRRFRELIETEWPLQDGRLAPRLLEQLSGADSRVCGVRLVVQRSAEQGLFFLKLRERHEVDSLSTREFVVAQLLTDGLTQKQIAAKLGRSPDTIRSQVKAIFAKLHINTVTLLPPLLVLRQ
ncbi:helix-turn-helix transcriptional regulator [Ramlibacter sp.]|uniref:helix-turn-helix transcriptional regulator n=1 Tax=Ramlibacter sp. TaxID=1917967 RepID=UPI002C97018E|nr:LuxR C-terminal-related transcriptional regulator [Ramlibacter sp.]HWI82990.1 LuxR C-terminal-related transcriptional regulator [Ramlibacter sp.]